MSAPEGPPRDGAGPIGDQPSPPEAFSSPSASFVKPGEVLRRPSGSRPGEPKTEPIPVITPGMRRPGSAPESNRVPAILRKPTTPADGGATPVEGVDPSPIVFVLSRRPVDRTTGDTGKVLTRSSDGDSPIESPPLHTRQPLGSAHPDLPVREAAVLHALAHKDADVPESLKRQFDVSESIELAARASAQPVTDAEDAALTEVERGADAQMLGNKKLTPQEINRRRNIIGLVAAGAVVYTGANAYQHAATIPQLGIERGLSEVQIEIGTQQVNILGAEITVPSLEETLENRAERIAEAQSKLDEAWNGTMLNVAFMFGALGAGVVGDRVASRGVAPIRAYKRRMAERTERAAWAKLGTSKAATQKQYDRRRQ